MKILVIIPARAGSKGLPGKNIRPLAGIPLFMHSVHAASAMADQRPNDEVKIVVSSDSLPLCQYAANAAPGVIGMYRDPELATDSAPTDAVLTHVMHELQLQQGYRPDLVVLLQPTVPVRRPGLVNDAIEQLVASGNESLLTASPLHFVWWRETAAADVHDSSWQTQCRRRPMRQAMEARELMFHEDGSVFVTRAELLERTGLRIGGRVEVLETEKTVDIDTEEDFVLAEALFALRARVERRSSEVA